ncbi:MAG: hypothetical protein AAB500_02895 [Patescibacteria group bacterium]
MRGAAIKIYSYTASVAASHEDRKRIVQFLLAGIALLGLFYASILCVTVWNIVERRALEREAQVLGNDVNELELAYIAELGKIDASYSKALGFAEVKPKFVSRNSPERISASAREAGRNEI